MSARSSDLVDRFRGGARSVGGEAARFGQDAARFGHEATKLGGDALRRVSTEVERRPLVMVAVAVGVGLLIGGRPPPIAHSEPSRNENPRKVQLFGGFAVDVRNLGQATTRRSRRLALRSKNSAWLAIADTVEGWNGFAIRNAGSGRSPVRKRSG